MEKWPGLAVPVINDELHKYPELYISELKRIGADMVWLAPRRTFIEETIRWNLDILSGNIRLLEDAGFTVGVWMQALGFGIPLSETESAHAPYQRIVEPRGRMGGDAFCPTDPDYTELLAMQIRSFVASGARIIMLDDDLCLNIRPGLGCICERHMKEYTGRLGHSVRQGDLPELLYTGKTNEERKVWLEVMGDSLKDFCRHLREEVDKIDPTVRMGFCAGYTSWDLEGVDALELTRVLAGHTRPFLRLTGAPYWAEMRRFAGQTMNHIVEFTRMQLKWCREYGKDVDFFSENDSYPRPAYKIPSAYLETFDFCMSSAGCENHLKYLLDYFSRPDYETGYADAHLRNRSLITSSAAALSDMRDAGVYIHEDMRKVAEMDFPETYAGDSHVMLTAFSSSANLLSGLGIATTYDDHGGVTAAFGHSGRTVSLDQKAYILDYTAAAEMMARGVDTGIVKAEEGPVPEYEWYACNGDRIQIEGVDLLTGISQFYRAQLHENARIESLFDRENDKFPSSYTYTNARGTRFLVFLFRGDTIQYGGSLTRSYYRQAQIAEFCRSCSEALPALISKKPGCYMLCREKEDALGIAICNFSMDEMTDGVVELQEEWGKAEFMGLSGRLQGKRIFLDLLPAHKFGTIILHR